MNKPIMPDHTNVKILEVDKAKLIKTLDELGAKKTRDSTLFIENYNLSASETLETKHANNKLDVKLAPLLNLLRVHRADGHDNMGLTLTLKHDKSTLELLLTSTQASVEVKNEAIYFLPEEKSALEKWLTGEGLKRTAHQEVKRLTFTYDKLQVDFEIKEWPSIPPYVKIEGKNPNTLLQAAKLIGYAEEDLKMINQSELFKRYSASSTYMSFADEETEISHEALVDLVRTVIKCHAPHLIDPEITLIAEHYIHAEYSGKKTHGLRKLCWDVQFYGDRLGRPRLTKDLPSMSLIDGRREIGPLAADLGTKMVIAKAKDNGVAVVGVTGAQRFGVLATWTNKIAEAGLIGVLTTSTEPFTALSETAKGVVGTNPLSISVPYKNTPLVYDAAFSKAPVNMMWLYRLLGQELPDETFLGEKGEYTNDPFRSRYADVFGGSKGSGLAIMLQMLSGPLMGVKSHNSFKEPYENAFFFQAIDPTFFQPMSEFEEQVEDFICFAKQAPLREGYDELHLPGEKSRYNLDKAIKKGKIRVHAGVVGWLEFLGSSK